MAGRLGGRRAIVTGAGLGIGRAAAVKLAREGARVGLIDVNEAAAQETLGAIRAGGGDGGVFAADVSDEGQIERAVLAAEQLLGGLDTVIGNAGVLGAGRDDGAERPAREDWRRGARITFTRV